MLNKTILIKTEFAVKLSIGQRIARIKCDSNATYIEWFWEIFNLCFDANAVIEWKSLTPDFVVGWYPLKFFRKKTLENDGIDETNMDFVFIVDPLKNDQHSTNKKWYLLNRTHLSTMLLRSNDKVKDVAYIGIKNFTG